MSNTPQLPLFVYGSLRSGFPSTAYEYISRYFHLVGPGEIQGQLYDMGEYPAAIPVAGNATIKGELYQIKDADEFYWALGQLDDYEGISPEPGEIPLYKREQTEVSLLSGEKMTAWVYWYNGSVDGKPRIHSGDILQYLQEKNK